MQYKDFSFKSINHSDAMEELQTDDDKKGDEDCKPLLKKIKAVLGDKVKDVLVSKRLTNSPSCIVADSKDPSAQMQKLFKQMFLIELIPETIEEKLALYESSIIW